MRREYEMSDAQLEKLLDVCAPTPVMYLSGGKPMFDSPQENANRAWKALGREMGFDGMTVEPVAGKPNKFFTAIEVPRMEETP